MIKQLSKTNLYETVLKELIEMIKNETWLQGERIPTEISLAEAFGISRNSIREALKVLELTGVLSAKAGKGTFLNENALNNIRRMELTWALRDTNSLDELMQIRFIIEPELAALAALNATEDDIKDLNMIIKNTIESINKNEYTVEIGMQFHLKIMEASKNKILYKFMISISDELCVHRVLRSTYYLDKNLLLEEIEEHNLMVDLITRGKEEEVREVSKKHLERGKKLYKGKD